MSVLAFPMENGNEVEETRDPDRVYTLREEPVRTKICPAEMTKFWTCTDASAVTGLAGSDDVANWSVVGLATPHVAAAGPVGPAAVTARELEKPAWASTAVPARATRTQACSERRRGRVAPPEPDGSDPSGSGRVARHGRRRAKNVGCTASSC